MQIVDLQYLPNGITPIIYVSQYDVGRQFQLKIYDGTLAYNMPVGTTARIDGIKPDAHGFSYTDAVSVSGNVVTVTTKEQMTIVEGDVECEVRFAKDGNDIGTLNFIMRIERSPINQDTDISETDLPAIFALAEEQMLNAEAWAKGTKNGTPVPSTAPQYENHAKHYSEEAEDHADDSEAYAVGKRDGVDVGDTDETYHNNSKYYSQQSAASATNSANSASQSLGYSRDSEAWAVGKRNGVDVPSTDGTYHNNSKYYSGLADSAYQQCLVALQDLEAYFAIIKLLLGTVYIVTETGDNIITEDGNRIIMDY